VLYGAGGLPVSGGSRFARGIGLLAPQRLGRNPCVSAGGSS